MSDLATDADTRHTQIPYCFRALLLSSSLLTVAMIGELFRLEALASVAHFEISSSTGTKARRTSLSRDRSRLPMAPLLRPCLVAVSSRPAILSIDLDQCLPSNMVSMMGSVNTNGSSKR